MPAALGFSQFTKCDYELGIIRNHYVGRSFIEPLQSLRQNTVKLKHSINKSAVKGKIVILIDDSLVRGTTAKQIVNMVFEAGAREVHITHNDGIIIINCSCLSFRPSVVAAL